MEEWKPILGYESLYEVSNLGGVRRVLRGKIFIAGQIREAKAMFEQGAKLREVAAHLNTSITTAAAIKTAKHGKEMKILGLSIQDRIVNNTWLPICALMAFLASAASTDLYGKLLMASYPDDWK